MKTIRALLLSDGLLLSLLLLLPVFMIAVKSWGTGLSFLLLAVALVRITASSEGFGFGRGRDFWKIVTALVFPFFSLVLAQVGAHTFYGHAVHWSDIDTASRCLVGLSVFLALSTSRDLGGLTAVCLGALVGTLATGIFSAVDPLFTAGGRLKSWNVDSITLGIYSVIFCGLGLCLKSPRLTKTLSLLKLLSVLTVTAVIFATQSRTALVLLMMLLVFFVVINREIMTKKRFLVPGLLILLGIILLGQEIFISRSLDAWGDWLDFLNGNYDTSVGSRLAFFPFTYDLLERYPYFGVSNLNIPDYVELKESNPFVTWGTYDAFVGAGPHNEILAQLLRRGIVLGPLAAIAIFVYPFLYFLKRLKSGDTQVKDAALTGVLFVGTITIGGMGVEVLSYKLTMTFYSIVIAVIFSEIFSREH